MTLPDVRSRGTDVSTCAGFNKKQAAVVCNKCLLSVQVRRTGPMSSPSRASAGLQAVVASKFIEGGHVKGSKAVGPRHTGIAPTGSGDVSSDEKC